MKEKQGPISSPDESSSSVSGTTQSNSGESGEYPDSSVPKKSPEEQYAFDKSLMRMVLWVTGIVLILNFLITLFEQHATIIKDLGALRKIKRFCNRIRFQYNMLSKDNTLTYDLLMYFSIMLLLLIESEKMKKLFLLPYKKFVLSVYNLHDKASREAYPHLSKDQIKDEIIDSLVLPNLYKLNRNVLV